MLSSEWDDIHNSNSGEWLGGSPPTDVLAIHGIGILPQYVMDIGIGNGDMSRFLLSQQCVVTSVDVSSYALNKSPAPGVLTKDLSTCPPVDLAICHLVLQHCEDEDVIQIVRDVPLGPNAVLSLQFASIPGEPEPCLIEHIAKRRLIFRSPEQYEELFTMAGRNDFRTYSSRTYGSIQWHIAKVLP